MSSESLQTCDVVDCSPRAEAATGTRQECVLLIEDSEEAMLLVRYALQEYGNGTYRLEWANGLSAGLHRLANGGVDLVLLDLGLPESSGVASYAAIRKAAPELPILVLTGDTRPQTESAVSRTGVQDYLVKDEVSGALLLEAMRSALYSNRKWQERKSSYKLAPLFHWSQEKCEALLGLGMRLMKLNRTDSVLACSKSISAIIDSYTQSECSIEGRADLCIVVERLARAAVTEGHNNLGRDLRAMIRPPAQCDDAVRAEFTAAMRQRVSLLKDEPLSSKGGSAMSGQADLAAALRQILESVQSIS